jgi:hypothetical protein
VAETLLTQTRYASANSAEVALRFQFKRRGWPLRTRAQARRAAQALGDDPPCVIQTKRQPTDWSRPETGPGPRDRPARRATVPSRC